jgi:hypothetical protein
MDGKPITDAGYRRTRRSFLVGSAAMGTLSFLRFGSSSYAEGSGINEVSTSPPLPSAGGELRRKRADESYRPRARQLKIAVSAEMRESDRRAGACHPVRSADCGRS